MKIINYISVDDEQIFLDDFNKKIKPFTFLNKQAEFTDPIEALEYINAKLPDVIFLDYEMPGFSGKDIVNEIKYNALVVFITNHTNPMQDIINNNGEAKIVRYLSKPLKVVELKETCLKLQHNINNRENAIVDNKLSENEYAFFHTNKGKVRIKLSHIRYIGHVKGGGDPRDKEMILEDLETYTLKNISIEKLLEDYLPDSQWIQVGRSVLIHLNAIHTEISKDEVELNITNSKNERIRCTIGDSYRKEFEIKAQPFTK